MLMLMAKSPLGRILQCWLSDIEISICTFQVVLLFMQLSGSTELPLFLLFSPTILLLARRIG